MKRVIAILEVMWDWRARTSAAGFREQAPRWFDINPENFTGRRLHKWLHEFDEFKVTNACPELVSSAKGRGTPSKQWLHENLMALHPFNLLLVCGRVAQETYEAADALGARVIELPHPAARCWNRQGLDLVGSTISAGGDSGIIRRVGSEFIFERKGQA